MKADDGCVCFLKIDDDWNTLLKQGDAQATKLKHSKAATNYLKAAVFTKKKCNNCDNDNTFDDSNHCNSSAKHSCENIPCGCVVKRLNDVHHECHHCQRRIKN